MRGGDNPMPIKILNGLVKSGVPIQDVFKELSKRVEAKRLFDIYQNKLVNKWRAGELSPSLFNSKVESLQAIHDSYNRFVQSVLAEGILRPFNSPAHKIETVRDWADAIETLFGFTNYFEQALFSKAISKGELEELEMFCNQYTSTPGTCVAPCDLAKKGTFGKEKICRVKGQKVDIKDKTRKPIIVKGIAFRNV